MKFLIVAPSIEEPKARGIHRILFNLLSTLKKEGHEIYLLVGMPYVKKVSSNYSLLQEKTIKTYLRYYFTKGRDFIRLPKHKILKQILSGMIKGHKVIKKDKDLHIPEIKILNFVDYIIQQPYILQLIYNRKNPGQLLLNKIIKKEGIDIVLTGDPQEIKISKKNKMNGVILVENILDFLPLEGTYLSADNYTLNFSKNIDKAIKNADHIITISEDIKNKILELRKDIPVSNLYSFVQFIDSKFELNISEESILNKFKVEKDKYFFFVSAIELRKNVDGLIEAYSIVEEQLNSDLLICGSPGFGYKRIMQIKDLQKNEVKKRIKVFPYVSEREKLILMKNAKAFVWPSKGEGLGIPVMEAMSVGTSVIASKLPTHIEIAGDSIQYIVDPYNIEDIAQNLVEAEKKQCSKASNLKKFSVHNNKWTREKYENRVRLFLKKIGVEAEKTPLYIFHHLAKTGGTTFVGNLYKHFDFDEEFIDLGPHGSRYRKEQKKKELKERTQEELRQIKIIAGHSTYWDTQDLFLGRDIKHITFIRNPVDRVISHYTFDTSETDKFKDFASWYANWNKNQMYKYFCDHLQVNSIEGVLNRLSQFWHIGFTENLDASLIYIFSNLGIDTNYKNRRVSGELKNSTSDLGYDDPEKVIREKYQPTKKELEMITRDHKIDIWLYNEIKRHVIKNQLKNIPKVPEEITMEVSKL